MWSAEHIPQPEENWGSHKNKSVGDIGFMRSLNMELSTLTWRNLMLIDLDAKSCYERILRPIRISACYKYGLPLHM